MLRSTCQWVLTTPPIDPVFCFHSVFDGFSQVPYDLSVMTVNDDGTLSGPRCPQELTEGYAIPVGTSIKGKHEEVGPAQEEGENETGLVKKNIFFPFRC